MAALHESDVRPRRIEFLGRLAFTLVVTCSVAGVCVGEETAGSDTLLGDSLGIRSALADVGLQFSLDYTAEVFANLDGGRSRGATYQGLIDVGLELDLEHAAGLEGWSAFMNVLNPHGKSPSAERVGDDQLVSNLDAYDTVRLQNLWVEGCFLDGTLALRAGQQAVDDEFMVTDGTDLFLHSAAGYNLTVSANAPVWPVASTAVLARFSPTDRATFRVAAFHADPDTLDQVDVNNDGLRFGWDSSQTLYIAEAEVVSELFDLDGVGRLGFWYDTNDFDDLAGRDSHDESLGTYIAVDHAVWREGGTETQGVRALMQYGWSPDDRSALDVDWMLGLVAIGLIDGRDDDAAGVAYMHPRVSREVRRSGPGIETEAALELTYRAEVRAGLSLQASVQYIDEPGGASASGFDDAIVFGLRAELRF